MGLLYICRLLAYTLFIPPTFPPRNFLDRTCICHLETLNALCWIASWSDQTKVWSTITQNYLYLISAKSDYFELAKRENIIDWKFMVGLWYYSKSIDVHRHNEFCSSVLIPFGPSTISDRNLKCTYSAQLLCSL